MSVQVLKHWKADPTPADMQQMGFTLLVELLAYQFASPVLWMQTQDLLFGEFSTMRCVELGPAPTLVGMAQRTLTLKYQKADQARNIKRDLLHVVKDRALVAYELEDKTQPPEEPVLAAGPVAAAPVMTPSQVPGAPAAPAAAVVDAPLTAQEVLHAMVASKLKKKLQV